MVEMVTWLSFPTEEFRKIEELLEEVRRVPIKRYEIRIPHRLLRGR
ncbi:MAG: hypothetical protein ABID38_06350 [Candidatus Diapherotrites archaeon]